MTADAFVAGATGYTGRELVRVLAESGRKVVAHVRPDSSRLDEWRERFAALGATLDTTPWERTQLTWVGPHGTLFLFTSASGRSQSMTRRLRDRLMAQGALRVVSEQTVVGEALDAVARTAMRNSVDTRY